MKKRFESLDVLRGITVAFMCIVNNPGSWSHTFGMLSHASWDGCTPTDLVYPFFVFCMGCAMAFSFSKHEGNARAGAFKVIKRALGIFLVGFLLNCFPFFPTSDGHLVFGGQEWVEWISGKRILGVLQRIAMAYLIAGLLAIWLKTPKKVGIAIGVLCVTFTAILLIFGREPGAFTLEGCVSRRIDVALFGENHVYHGYHYADGTRAAFDPEGVLGSLTAAASCLLGYLIGKLIKGTNALRAEDPSNPKASESYMVCRIFFWGIVSIVFAEFLDNWIPINKPLWSASYVFFAGGWAMVVLAFLTFCVDILGAHKMFEPFKAMGSNALMAFILSGVFAKCYQFIGGQPGAAFFSQNEITSLLYAVLFALVIFCCLWPLYKKNIYIRL